MPGIVVDGHDFFDVYEVAGKAVKRARTGDLSRSQRSRESAPEERLPSEFLHQGGVGRARDFSTRAVWAGLVREDDLVSIDREISDLIEDAVSLAKAAPKPDAEDLLTDVYASY